MTLPAAGNKRSVCIQSIPPGPPSPASDGDHSVQKEMSVKCFFAVLDPEGTAKLKGTKHSACSGSFKSVNRLKEHLWRAHSPTHNCKNCRKKTTKPTEDFKKLHAQCKPAKIARPLPTLISSRQAESLGSLNQHYNKPNTETARCEKLWNALFPGQDFDQSRFVGSDGPDGADGEQPRPNNKHTSSTSRKPGQQPKAPSTVAQNATPPASPRASQGPEETDTEPLFSLVKKPKGKTGIAEGIPTHDSAIDMGDDTNEKDNNERGSSRRQSVVDITMNVGTGLETPQGVYPTRVLVGEDSTLSSGKDFGVRRNSPDVLSAEFARGRSRSASTESTSSRCDTDMSESEGSEGEEDSEYDNMSTGGDSGVSDMDIDGRAISDAMDAVWAIYSHDYEIAARGGNWDSDRDIAMGSDSDC